MSVILQLAWRGQKIRNAKANNDNGRSPTANNDDIAHYASVTHKCISVSLTLLLHCGIAAGLLELQNHGFSTYGGGQGIIFLLFCAVHLALLLSFVGPGHPGRIFFFGVGYWVPHPLHDSWGCLALNLIGLVHFLGVSVIELQAHTKPCDADVSELCKWSVIDRLYYSVVLMTTVGYGNSLIPQTLNSRLFTLTFLLYALIIFGATSFVLGNAVSDLKGQLLKPWLWLRERLRLAVAEAEQLSEQDPSQGKAAATACEGSPPAFTPPKGYDGLKGLYFNFVAFIVLNFVSAAIFVQLEDGWSFSDGLYFCTITASTIGLGDIAPHSQEGRAFGMFHMILSVVLFAQVIGTVLSVFESRRLEQEKSEMLSKNLDEQLIISLDTDGDGVDKTEFVLGMLTALGMVTAADCAPFLEQFERFDKQGDGKLTHDDLVLLAQDTTKHQKAETRHGACEQTDSLQALRASAARLLLPIGTMCFSFVWSAIFGYLLLASGLFGGLGVVIALGSPPSACKRLQVSAGLAVASALSLIIATSFVIWWLVHAASYLRFDSLMADMLLSTFDENNLVVAPDDSMKEKFLYPFVHLIVTQADFQIIMVLYITFFALSVIGELHFAYRCVSLSRARVEPLPCARSEQPVVSHELSATAKSAWTS